MKTYLRVKKIESDDAQRVARYLPDNYAIVSEDKNYVYVKGEDYAGWTAKSYVIPRLQSGLIFAEVINEATFVAGTRPGE